MKNIKLLYSLGLLVLANLGVANASDLQIVMTNYEATASEAEMVMDVKVSASNNLLGALDGGTPVLYKLDLLIRERTWYKDSVIANYQWFAEVRRLDYSQGYRYRRFGEQNWYEVLEFEEVVANMSEFRLKFDDPSLVSTIASNPDIYFEYRVEVDINNLPNLLRVDLLTSSDWNFSSGWVVSRP